ncbi:MAG: lipopolysaccharide heptosyltransferase I [Magnetococcales bacterium]|nr:lipopolysaccharide heptosyltransferase I [Magnetococcales bacterium]
MNLLLIKTSSLGDVLHTLPALRETFRHRPEIRVHWVVEEAFAQIPLWAPNVVRVLPVAWRRWRRHPWEAWRSGEPGRFLDTLRSVPFDRILDAQGLIKSAVMARLATGEIHGLDRASAREPWAAALYHQTHRVTPQLHAAERLRLLFAQALQLPSPHGPPDFALDPTRWPAPASSRPYVVFLHGTTWRSKLWPESHWQELARLASQAGITVSLPWGNETERQRAETIAAAAPEVCRVLPRCTLEQLAAHLAHAHGVIATDTGPAHLAAALGVPTVGLYGPTPTERIGIVGPRVRHRIGLCPRAPCRQRVCPLADQPDLCLRSLEPGPIWETLRELVRS